MRRLLIAACVAAACGPLLAGNWPTWRGPELNGISDETDLPVAWSTTENIAWKQALPGRAGATPVIWGERIFLTSADKDDLLLICFRTDGKELWRRKIGTGDRFHRNDEGNECSASPSTDGRHVWAFVGSGDLVCYDLNGKLVWHVDIPARYGRFKIQFGMSSTPVLHEGKLYLQLIHGEGDPETREARVVCLDAATGNEVWNVERPSEAYAENEHSYASPTLYRDDKTAFLVTHGADYVIAHDLETGREIWRCGGLHSPSRYDPTLRLVASPVAVPGLIVAPSAKGGRVLAIKPGGSGTITDNKEFIAWTFGNTPDVPSPLVHDGIVYLCQENGVLQTLDRASGKLLYEQRIHAGDYRASPVLADGKLYCTCRDGTVSVFKAGPKFELLSENDMQDRLAASPAISGGRIYLRTFGHLYAVGK